MIGGKYVPLICDGENAIVNGTVPKAKPEAVVANG